MKDNIENPNILQCNNPSNNMNINKMEGNMPSNIMVQNNMNENMMMGSNMGSSMPQMMGSSMPQMMMGSSMPQMMMGSSMPQMMGSNMPQMMENMNGNLDFKNMNLIEFISLPIVIKNHPHPLLYCNTLDRRNFGANWNCNNCFKHLLMMSPHFIAHFAIMIFVNHAWEI